MTVRLRAKHARRALLAVGAAAALTASTLLVASTTSPARAATQEPCDIYAAAGTPCVAAHSTTRALYAAYSGPLYQVRRASDNATTNISPLSAGRGRQRRHAEFVLRGHHMRHHGDLRPVRQRQQPHRRARRRRGQRP